METDNKQEPEYEIKNENLFKTLLCLPIGIGFAVFMISAFNNSGFNVGTFLLFVLTMYFTLSGIAYAAFYTNEKFDCKPH
ncbi:MULTISPECIES: hypothetical protein [Pseudoalteromonas]|uniref:hypothetical protein n=1 Tax=Pseudoalteromonas TaxID=53246 RepID=UPI00026CB7EA|nr:hypothetical protein [Pseudoalteromonas spongiae]ATC98437.1 hypothetical protein PSPO_a1340 [Pseudoalteromonas spongiae UST010723-006]